MKENLPETKPLGPGRHGSLGFVPFSKAGPGRPKGSKTKGSPLWLRDTVLKALAQAGDKVPGKGDGATKYLTRLARQSPKTFAILLAKIIPTKIEGEIAGLTIRVEFPDLQLPGLQPAIDAGDRCDRLLQGGQALLPAPREDAPDGG